MKRPDPYLGKPLSDTEAAVARLILQGMNTRAIAKQLGSSKTTVNTLMHRARRKVGVANNVQFALSPNVKHLLPNEN